MPFAVNVEFPAPVHVVRLANLARTVVFGTVMLQGPAARTVSSKLPVFVGTVPTLALTPPLAAEEKTSVGLFIAARVNEEALVQTLAIVDGYGQVIGGAFNETMPDLDASPEFREDDPFLAAVFVFVEPIFALLGVQDAEALTALSNLYLTFREAYAEGKVGHHFMVARSDALAKADTFELVAASAEHYQALGYAFMVVQAINQWTGAACEALGRVQVHFAPFQARPTVRQSVAPLEDVVTSSNRFLSGKDSGSMFYVIRLA